MYTIVLAVKDWRHYLLLGKETFYELLDRKPFLSI
jgi:hypothetical protein